MAGLGEAVEKRVSRARSAGGEPRRELSSTQDFGSNPGSLGMRVHVPRETRRGAPLVVVLHGCGQTASGYAESTGWIALAEREGFVLLCPEQSSGNNANRCFNWFQPQDVARGSGEAASIAAMVERAVADHGIDPKRVFITGLSAGGAMAAAMLAAYPELFAAGAIVAGLPVGAAGGLHEALSAMRNVSARTGEAWGDRVRLVAPPGARWPRVSVWHGDADTTVAPAAGDALVLQWTDVHGLKTRPEQVPTASPRHRHAVWRGPDGQVRVESHRVAGLGHGAPIAASGPDGCGAPAPWVLEAGVSSTVEIARSWGLVDRDGAASDREAPRAGAAPPFPAKAAAGHAVDVGEVISQALRKVGLLR